MKTTFGIVLSVWLLCGCSQKHTSVVDQSVDIVAGKDIAVRDYVVSVQKRDGSSIEGIRIVRREPDGKETTITADTGTLTQTPKQRFESKLTDTGAQGGVKVIVIFNSVTMTLSNAFVQTKEQSGTTRMTVQKMEIGF